MKVFQPSDYDKEFEPDAYLKFYYSSEALNNGTRLSLFVLPMFARIIQETLPEEERQSMIDIGSGPTIYSAICFRNTVKRIYLSDFCESNLEILHQWLSKTKTKEVKQFDWSSVIRIITNSEGVNINHGNSIINEAEGKTKAIISNGGIFYSNVLQPGILSTNSLPDKTFDILISIFCLEGACSDYDEYSKAFNNLNALIRPGGRLILGSVIEDDTYNAGINKWGEAKIFSVLNLSRQQIFGCLESSNSFDMKSIRTYSLDAVMFLMITKNA